MSESPAPQSPEIPELPPDTGFHSSESNLLIRRLKALAHPIRLHMVERLCQHDGEICVCQFENMFDLKQPTISHHLKILREAGLINSRQVGTWVHYSPKPDTFHALGKWIQDLPA